MPRRLIITLTAANRVGILAAVSNALAELGGDLQEIRQTVVQKFFTMIIAADFPEHRDPQVVLDHIGDVCRPYAVEVTLKDPEQEYFPEAPDPDEQLHRYWLTISGRNEPEVMRRVSARLACDRIDIWNLHAVSVGDGESFRFHMEIAAPVDVDLNQLHTDLVTLGRVEPLSVVFQSLDVEDSSIYQRTSMFLPDLTASE